MRELGTRLDSAELSEWLAFDRVEPIGDPWEHTAQTLSLQANLLASGGRRYTVRDFHPGYFGLEQDEQTGEEQLRQFDGRFKTD